MIDCLRQDSCHRKHVLSTIVLSRTFQTSPGSCRTTVVGDGEWHGRMTLAQNCPKSVLALSIPQVGYKWREVQARRSPTVQPWYSGNQPTASSSFHQTASCLPRGPLLAIPSEGDRLYPPPNSPEENAAMPLRDSHTCETSHSSPASKTRSDRHSRTRYSGVPDWDTFL
jgi:hypothetical protein